MLRAHVATGGTPRSSPPAPAPPTASSSSSANPTPPQRCWSPARRRRPAWSACSRVRCTTASSLPGANLVIITETDLTGNRVTATEGKRLAAKRRNVVDPLALTAGDLVVHDQHGIGRFVEMTERMVGGARREYLVLEYASAKRGGGSDKLFVPMDSLDQLSRYVGGAGADAEPSSAAATGPTPRPRRARPFARSPANWWRCTPSGRPRPGYAFGPDTPWQAEMEDAFGFTETIDQLTAITEVKSDMEKPVPMDRVICGDVGYGKTEIAVRAAFKAVQDGKQVAVLVPTTLLADQHLQTFTARMAGFPGDGQGAVPVHRPGRVPGGARGHEGRLGRHRHRHAPAAADRRDVEGPRPRRRRRGAALRRRAQGAHQVDAHPRRRADDERHPDPAHAGDEPGGHPRDVDDPHPARGALPGADLRRPARRQAGRRGAAARTAARRAGVLHPQPGPLDRPGRRAGAGAGARGAGRRGARADARGAAGAHRRGVLEPRVRHPGLHDDRRDRAWTSPTPTR